MNRFYAEANGLVRSYLVRHNDPVFMLGCMLRDPQCGELVRAIRHALERLDGTLCLACQHRFENGKPGCSPGAFMCLCPGGFEQPSNTIIASPICEPCSGKSDQELLKALAKAWPSFEIKTAVVPEWGHA